MFSLACGPSESQKVPGKTKISISESPESIKAEHTELHHQLEQATNHPCQTGILAKEVAAVLHPNFKKEEAFALPPLTLLPELARDNVTDEMKDYVPLTDTLKKNWDRMLEEHKQIKQKLDLLEKAATDENQKQVVQFVVSLKMHARTEEEILYPAAILIGNYLKLKQGTL